MVVSWVRIDDVAPHHKKQLAAGPAACWLWVCGLTYTQRLKTDVIPLSAVPFLGVVEWQPLGDRLVDAGLWERCEEGYRVHDLYDYHPTPEQRSSLEHQRQARNARYVATRKTRLTKNSQTQSDASYEKTQDGAPIPIPIPIPDPSTTTTQNVVVVRTRAKPLVRSSDVGFEAFWRVYPKRRSKHDAERAWAKLKPDEALQAQILTAVEAQCRSPDWLKEGGKFIPYPASWLNAGGWKDESVQIPQVTERNVRSLQAIYGDD